MIQQKEAQSTEVLREIINSNRLKTLLAVPKSMENMDVEVIALPLADN